MSIEKKYAKFLFYITEWLPQGIFSLYHELSHALFIFPFWVLGICSFPILKIEIWSRLEFIEEKTYTYGWFMTINYSSNYNIKIINRLCSIMPIFSTILLFYISPIYLWLFYIPFLRTLLPSISDIEILIYGNY